nr:WXG100 family type VII secretion target [uncultured Lachnoclostridium sp.]
MAANSQLSMTYADMEKEIAKLKNFMSTFETTTSKMTSSVNMLCDNWKAQASPVYRADYTKLAKNFTQTKTVVDQLIKSTEKYIADMQKLDQAYSKSKVQ